MNKLGFSVVVPVFNEEKSVGIFLPKLQTALSKTGINFEIVVVNDGSKDGTLTQLQKLNYIKLVDRDINGGYGSAIKHGILESAAEKVLIIDGDDTYPIEKIPDLIEHSHNSDMVVGARTLDKTHHSMIKRLAKWPINQIANYLVGFKIPDLNSGLRIFRKDLALKYFRLLPNGFSLTTNITLAFLSDGHRVKYVPIDYHRRTGKSKVSPFSDALNYLVLVIRMILFYNPLKFFLPLAGIFFILTAWALIYDIFILRDLTQKSLILFVGFIQVVILGFIADLINKRSRD